MNNFEKNKNIEALLEDIAKLPIDLLAYLVRFLEDSEPGKIVVLNNPNRKLYAVAKPTSDEYLQRLRVLLDLDGEQGAIWRSIFRLTLPMMKFYQYMLGYHQRGQISCVVYDDLVDKLLLVCFSELGKVVELDFFKQDFAEISKEES